MNTLPIKQIKEQVGDAWALIANPQYSPKTGQLEKGILLYYNPDKTKVHQESMNCTYNHITVRYFGEFDNNQIFVL